MVIQAKIHIQSCMWFTKPRWHCRCMAWLVFLFLVILTYLFPDQPGIAPWVSSEVLRWKCSEMGLCVCDVLCHRLPLGGESRRGFEQGHWSYDEMFLCQNDKETSSGIHTGKKNLHLRKFYWQYCKQSKQGFANFLLFCFSGQVERQRSFWPGVPNFGTEGDMVFWTPVQH